MLVAGGSVSNLHKRYTTVTDNDCWDGIMNVSISNLSATSASSIVDAKSVAFEVVETSSEEDDNDDDDDDDDDEEDGSEQEEFRCKTPAAAKRMIVSVASVDV